MCKNETRFFSLILHKTQLQYIKDLNIRFGTPNLMEEEVGKICELMAQERNIYSLQTGAVTMISVWRCFSKLEIELLYDCLYPYTQKTLWWWFKWDWPTEANIFKCLIPRWSVLGSIRNVTLLEEVCHLKFKTPCQVGAFYLCPQLVDQKYCLSSCFSTLPACLPACYHASCCDDQEFTLWSASKPPIKGFLL